MSVINPLSKTNSDTAVNLYRFLTKKSEDLDFRAVVDFIGIHNLNDNDKVESVLDVYSDLISNKCIDNRHLRRCYANNSLNNLIHHKNIKHPSEAYKKYFSQLIVIPETPFGYKGPKENIQITSDSCCINCDIELEDRKQIQCGNCKLYVCSKCSNSDMCFNCHFNENTSNVAENINKKVMAFNLLNNTNISYVEARVKIANSKLICSLCGDKVLLLNWKKNCCYQFDFYLNSDKKLEICCSYCKNHNKLQYFQQLKACNSLCHSNKDDKTGEMFSKLNKDLIDKKMVSAGKDGFIELPINKP
jgi:hypothetical protein